MADYIPGLSFDNGGLAPKGLTLSSFGQGTPVNIPQAFNSGGLSYDSGPTKIGNYNVPTQSQGVLGASTSSGGGAPAGADPHINPQTGNWDDNYFQQQQQASGAAQSAELGRANTQYDYLASQLQNQLSGLDTQKQNATNEIDTGLSGVQNQVGLSRQNAQTNTDQQIQQAGSIAHSTQQQNRNVLRALGIINSSAAGELLSKPINEFGKQRANVQQALTTRFSELDNTLDQATKEAANKKNEILSNYSQLYSNIQNDLRFNDRQRVDALNSINAAASQHLADIQGQMLNYQNQVNLQKQSFAQQLAQIAAYNNPSIASNYLSQLQLNNSGAGQSQTAQIYQDPNQKKQAGFLS